MLKQRKNIRLRYFDYNSAGAYFVTFCTHNQDNILASFVGAIHESPEMILTDYGIIVDNIIKNLQYQNVSIPYYTVMPNHVHLVIIVNDNVVKNTRSIVSNVIGFIKMNASKQAHKIDENINVWQRGFYDHVIRDENDYISIVEYIQNNPLKWVLDKYYK
ncbi:MAG: hypothetical protein E7353_07015 [Clostridiales bacterium]|nr:hypothetical protein [Clostridiales bacterium]